MDDKLKKMIIDRGIEEFKKGNIKSIDDAADFLKDLLQPLTQKMLDTELDIHLNSKKYERNKDKDPENSRNGYCTPKTVKTKYGNIQVSTPRDRKGTFQPIVVKKGQNKISGLEEKCISLYAKGMSLRDMEDILEEIYGIKISKNQISLLISTINEEVEKWRNRPLEPIYAFAYADCLHVSIKNELGISFKKAVYVVIGVNAEGYKDILGIWIDKTESASFWTSVFEELKSRGVQDILYMTSDGVAGFKGSLENSFNKTQAQRCVVHLSRNLRQITPEKKKKEVVQDFKKIYSSPNLESAKIELENFINKHEKLSKIVEKVKDDMQYLEPLFELPKEIRKVIYTSNPVESANSALRKVTNGKGSFPSDEAVYKVMYLRIRDLTTKWSKPIPNWRIIREQLIEIHGERFTKYLNI